MKYCGRCGRVKPLDCFGSNVREKDKKQQWCFECRKAYRASRFKPKNDPNAPRKGVCISCGAEFVLLSKKRLYCSHNCKFNFNKDSLKRIEWVDNNPEKLMWYRTKYAASRRGVPFEIEPSDIDIPEHCPVLGLKLMKSKEKPSDNSPSLDKIIPELGYVKGNVRVISQRANLLKSNATLEELRLVYEDAKKNQT